MVRWSYGVGMILPPIFYCKRAWIWLIHFGRPFNSLLGFFTVARYGAAAWMAKFRSRRSLERIFGHYRAIYLAVVIYAAQV